MLRLCRAGGSQPPTPRAPPTTHQRQAHAHHQRPAGVGMKRRLCHRRSVASFRTGQAKHRGLHSASREGPPRQGRHRHDRQPLPARDLRVRFQRGEADLVVNPSEHHQRLSQAAGFQCSALVASKDWPPAAAATSVHRPDPPPTSAATSPARTSTCRQAPEAVQRHLPTGHPGPPPSSKPLAEPRQERWVRRRPTLRNRPG